MMKQTRMIRISFFIVTALIIGAFWGGFYFGGSLSGNADSGIQIASVEDQAYFEETLHKIIQTRERTKQRLTELGFTFRDSKSNFIFASHKSCPAEELFEMLKQKDIYVRYFKKPRIDNYLRITIGTDAEMDEFLTVVEQYLKDTGRL